ncbi:MAG: bacteriohemerythrin [Proteobacteria bacterium]|nr:bacteriohemerythrin [Pseudomonadota bacterium]MBU1737129.1 bacteriohemerythrin [Pseudomonadota bacterium]
MNSYILWNDSYRVGIEEIDEQHRKLFEEINNLLNAVRESLDADIVEHLLNEMTNYVDCHFRAEQLYLEKHPRFKEHYLMHWEFTRKNMELVKMFQESRESAGREMADFLVNWLLKHVIHVDREYFLEMADLGLLP